MKGVAIVSGGLDSVTMAYALKGTLGHDLHILSFDYGQKHKVELHYANRCAESLRVPYTQITLPIQDLLYGSALTDYSIPIPEGHYEAESMKVTVVPNRNAIFLSLAYALAVSTQSDFVATAVHSGDHHIYPDCRPQFLKAFDLMENYATEGHSKEGLHLLTPFVEKTKAWIVTTGAVHNVPFQYTWSCYKGGLLHCGKCGTCIERKEAFAVAEIEDPTVGWRDFLPMDSATRIFVLEKSIELAKKSRNAEIYENTNTHEGMQMAQIRPLLAAEEMAAEVVERYPDGSGFADWASGSLHRLEAQIDLYGLCVKTEEKTFLLLRSSDDVKRELSVFEKAFAGDDVSYEILDENGQAVGGTGSVESEEFLTSGLGENMPGWKIKLYFADSDVFSKFASRQVTIYVWAGVLVIVLILAAGGFAVQTVGRQMKLNRLKNDFIATVTHELKTPLASMRVLVDTLLEGNYKEQKQATEYLELIARENERLSNLIDNFLTFSRMERNKQAFEMLEASPALIASRAAEAVKTKFEQGHCAFDVAVDENLPAVQADQDAMVTALINLLDNSYKYSYDDKQIKLSVYAEVGSVCFRVTDNGIGMSRSAQRKIFERFYQADQTLSRRSQGCGLGLSIVKFIVDAHNGSVNLESKPNKGSVFTIKLPAVENEQYP